ncbi:guanine nucleotide-releasing factor 2 isoform X3 [Leptidea sinapis]|uniref:guanine nucleotide-releasing factor 2 isoform X3 n=1 Tax=Leptidea sinapis TaxID=189913 RepID=UPI0021C4579A|nr:guanine nucleotide-releasing factor 2 isoform X3 [Leptidea sinapis]
MFSVKMPHYDESFMFDDSVNQRRNKRSYRVFKNGLHPCELTNSGEVLHTLEERGNNIVKHNIRNLKGRNRYRIEKPLIRNGNFIQCKTPEIFIHYPEASVFDPSRLYDIKNNNNILTLTPCKSFDNLTLKELKKEPVKETIRNGKSLQNLSRDESLKHFISPVEENLTPRKVNVRNSYSIEEAGRRPAQRRYSRSTAAPGVGVYRKFTGDEKSCKNLNDNEGGGEGSSGHRGSLRGANKLARRARSFKDDLLERISNMRSPAQTPPHLANIRSHSPLSPKLRNMGAKTNAAEDNETTPAKELERLVKEVRFGLKHFSDVITKRKLEMLPDNGTIVFESIANIHKAIKPYCSRSPPLSSAVKRLCTALAMLIRLCDEVTVASLRSRSESDISAQEASEDISQDVSSALSPEHVGGVVKGLRTAVEEVSSLAQQYMTRPALSPRPALVSPRATTQRNSLPDIPLTPKERSLLTGEAGSEASGVRASHSSESILDAPDTPPPKPTRPNRKIELAPPLPPKRKSANDNSLLGVSIDRLSLQSHSSGSQDSMLNVSNDEERSTHDFMNHEVFISPPTTDLVGICNCNNMSEMRTSVGSHESHMSHAHTHSNHNRFSNESGFVSVGHSEMSTEHSFTSTFSSHHYSSHTDSTFESTEFVSEMKCTTQSIESRMNMMSVNNVSSHSTNVIMPGVNDRSRLASITSDESETPPELPAKTRRNIRADVQHHFPNVEIRSPPFSVHDARPHTLAEHNHQRPPPLPLKKKHIMAYMEMFGNCSHTISMHPPISADAPLDMIRHSIHTDNLSSAQHTSASSISVGYQQVQRSLASSVTVQHLSTPPLSGSEDSVSMRTSSRNSPVPIEPPALPPKMNKNKQISMNSSNELVPPSSPRPSSHNSSADESLLNNTSREEVYVSVSSPGKFPLDEDELDRLRPAPSPPPSPLPSPAPSQRSACSNEAGQSDQVNNSGVSETEDIVLQTDVSGWLLLKSAAKDGPDVRGGHPDALIVLATKATKDFAYQEAFLATYRTWLSPGELVKKLVRRAHHFRPRPHELRSTLGLLTRVIADLTIADLERNFMQEIMEFIYWLVEAEELPISKALRQILVDKQKQLHYQNANNKYGYESACYGSVSLRRDTLLEFKAGELAEQMTLLDAALFVRITTAELLAWPRDQAEDGSPNLTRFTEHFNKMSYWARSRILEQDEARERERYASKFLKVMKALRKMNNFNSYLALVSALDCPPVRRLGWPRTLLDALHDHCSLIDSSMSFSAYRRALADTQPPCIPYIGLFLQDLTFVHVGNPDLLPDGSINFTKRWQQYHIMENMKRFHKEQYKIKKNERIQAMFNEFDDVLSEETMWQISETIKPRGVRGGARSVATPPAAQTATAAAT